MWQDILFGVPQGSILGLLLFNIFLADLFFTLNNIEIANYADDTTPYSVSDDIDDLISSLEKSSKDLLKWFDDNLMKSNPDKCHLLVNSREKIKVKIGDFEIENSTCEKLLGVHFGNRLTFDYHISGLFKKASKKINALARVMNLSKRKILMNAFFDSQFKYCPLIWMCHSCTNNRKIDRLHERCLRITYNDKQSSFKKLLEKDRSVSIHERNVQILASEMYKVSNNFSPPHINEIFEVRNEHPYNLRQNSQFSRPSVKSVYHGTESLYYLGPKIWDILPNIYKNIDGLHKFKKAIKKWKPEN